MKMQVKKEGVWATCLLRFAHVASTPEGQLPAHYLPTGMQPLKRRCGVGRRCLGK